MNLSQSIFQQRLSRFAPALKTKAAQKWPSLMESTFYRMASPSSPANDTSQNPEEVLIGLLMAKYPHRKSAVQKFAGVLDTEVQGNEALDLSDPTYWLKCERSVAKLTGIDALQPIVGSAVAIRGRKTNDERFNVTDVIYPAECAIRNVDFTHLDSLSSQAKNIYIRSSLPPAGEEFEALYQFCDQCKFGEIVIVGPTTEPTLPDFRYSACETFLETQYNYKEADQMISLLLDVTNRLHIVPGLSDPTTRSYPLRSLPQIFELSRSAQFQFSPFNFTFSGKNVVVVEQIMNDTIQILQSQLLIPQAAALVDVYNADEEFNYVDNIDVIVLTGCDESGMFVANVNEGETVTVVKVKKGRGVVWDGEAFGEVL